MVRFSRVGIGQGPEEFLNNGINVDLNLTGAITRNSESAGGRLQSPEKVKID